MDPQILIQELERLRDGMPGAESRVLFALARTSLFLLAADTGADDGAKVVVKVRLVDVQGRRTAYVFSSEEGLTKWCASHGFQPNSLPVHGGDVQILLPGDTWIHLDPDSQ